MLDIYENTSISYAIFKELSYKRKKGTAPFKLEAALYYSTLYLALLKNIRNNPRLSNTILTPIST